MSDANARLTVHGRALLVRRALGDRRPVSHVAKEPGVPLAALHHWMEMDGQEDGLKSGAASDGAAKLREATRRIRPLE